MEIQYPKHLYDETRREIAISYIRHELRKLFLSLKENDDFIRLDQDVARWFSDNHTLAPVRDFWNGLHGISMGFRLKKIVTSVTSKNIAWERRAIPVSGLTFGAAFEELSIVGRRPTVEQVREWYFDPMNVSALEKARVAHLQRSGETAPRDQFPIIVHRMELCLLVLDGNRRLLKAILEQRDTIDAFVGTQIADPLFLDSWIPTSLLIELVRIHRGWRSRIGEDATKTVTALILELIQYSSVGKMELADRCVDTKKNVADKALMEEIEKLNSLDSIPFVGTINN